MFTVLHRSRARWRSQSHLPFSRSIMRSERIAVQYTIPSHPIPIRQLPSLSMHSHNFVADPALFLPSPKTYPAAAGLNPLLKGIGNGGRLHVSKKKTGCVMAGLYIGDGASGGLRGVAEGGMASICVEGAECCDGAWVARVCCWWRGLGGGD